jgi:hypothetical protein
VAGFPSAAVELVDLGAAAEPVSEHSRARVGLAESRQQLPFGAGFAHLQVPAFETEIAGQTATPRVQTLDVHPGAGQQLLVRVPTEHGVLVAVHLSYRP